MPKGKYNFEKTKKNLCTYLFVSLGKTFYLCHNKNTKAMPKYLDPKADLL